MMRAKRRKSEIIFMLRSFEKPIKRFCLKFPHNRLLVSSQSEQIIIIVAQAAIFSQSVTEHGFKLC